MAGLSPSVRTGWLKLLMKPATPILLAALLCHGAAGAAAAEIEVRGLFTGAAVLVIDGREQFIRAGEVSPEGVRLVEASADEARVEVDGEIHTLLLSQHIGASFTPASGSQVLIQMNDNHQYRTPGSINGRPVSFLVDTGANVIAINADMAHSLGLSLEQGEQTRVSTASATHAATRVRLEEVQVGEIRVSQVPAVIIAGDHPREILLGMSFLRHVNISENNGLMVLKSKF